ncbi:TM1266 family iron-only hydrogenase system putative regulator [Eubacterium oxidoreducens]|uniref:Putative iron-only hydrogenase system regulator n=1 Tax=Eubacterium oxidoreducens TaxID=1732 RepID=A0A1G6BSX8_EUBOX|nr:TM1266 family iron-only hydrogenase system putative regulator [Eubacterium oxidoreducens]SDB23743.1 putative iron-only hydrogenase system regulator [Eubacterium oxidoreducens]
MGNRVALIGIIVDGDSCDESIHKLNEILHDAREYIIGRMGVPYREKGISMISVALDAPNDVISSVSGKIGMLKGVTAKAIYSNK